MNKGIKIDRDGTIWKGDAYKGRIIKNYVSIMTGTFWKYAAYVDKGHYMKSLFSDSYRLIRQNIMEELV